MRTYRCIAPNPLLDKRTTHNKLMAKELQDDRNVPFIPNQLQILFSSSNQAKLHHMIMH